MLDKYNNEPTQNVNLSALFILTEIVDKRVNNKSSANDTDRTAQMDETIVHVEFGHASTIRFNVSQIADVPDSVL